MTHDTIHRIWFIWCGRDLGYMGEVFESRVAAERYKELNGNPTWDIEAKWPRDLAWVHDNHEVQAQAQAPSPESKP